MVQFMLVTFAFLAWAFYVMSGGADFDPDRARAENSNRDPLMPVESPEQRMADAGTGGIEVTRVSLNLTSVENVANGGSDVQRTSREALTPVPAVQTGAQAETNEIIPSLIANATPEAGLSGTNDEVSATAERVSLDTNTDYRVVSGSRVNVRGGPGTNYGGVDSLVRGDRVEVLEDPGTGWVRMRSAQGGTVGWMADFLLTDG